MGNVIKRKILIYSFILLLLVLLLCPLLFITSSDRESSVRIEINPLIQDVSDHLAAGSLPDISQTEYLVCVFSPEGYILSSSNPQYKVGAQVDLSTLGGSNQYLVPVMKNDSFLGLLLARYPKESDLSAKLPYVISIISVFLFVLFLLCRTISLEIFLPLKQIHASTKDILRGDYNSPVKYGAKGEIGLLCLDFESMRDEIKAASERQQLSKEKEHALYAGISHDLKTPLAVINGYLEQIYYNVINDPLEIKKALSYVLTKIKLLNKLIDDILEHSKNQINEFTIEKQGIYCSEYFGKLLLDYTDESQKLGYHFTYDNPPQIWLQLDTVRIRQVFQNIIDNSVKYGAKNISVAFTELNKDTRQDNRILVISISDDGGGIEAADLPFIFDLLYRGHKTKKSEIPGSGMGLYICKCIIEQHQGQIECDSIIGRGTTISFSLPV